MGACPPSLSMTAAGSALPAANPNPMTYSIWQRSNPSPQPARACDAVVVGGGIAGVSTALALARRHQKTLLLEARTLAACASGRNIGFVLTGTAEHYAAAIERYGREKARLVWQASTANRQRLFATASDLHVPLEHCGSLLACVDAEEAAAAQQSARLLNEDGFEGTFEPSDPLHRGFVAALAKPGDAAVDPVALVRAIAAAATTDGVEILENAPVWTVEPGLVHSAAGTIRTNHIVVAAGPYTPHLLPQLPAAIAPFRGQVLATAPGPRVLATLVYANHGYDYARQLPDGRFLAGGSRDHAPEGEVGFEDRVTAPIQAGIEEFLHQYFAEVKAPVETRWAGTMEFTEDLLPLVGAVPGMRGVHVCAGFSGHGLAFALEAAARVVAAALDGEGAGVFDAGRRG